MLDMYRLGDGAPDLLVGYLSAVNVLVEVKTQVGKLNKDQEEFIDLWRGRPVVVVRDEHDVDNLLQRIITEQIPLEDGEL